MNSIVFPGPFDVSQIFPTRLQSIRIKIVKLPFKNVLTTSNFGVPRHKNRLENVLPHHWQLNAWILLTLISLVHLSVAQTSISNLGSPAKIADEKAVNVADESDVDFNRDIRPILSDRCFKCHGPDENTRDSDLRLDEREYAADYLEGDSLAEIELWDRITSDDPDVLMPPPDSKLSVTSKEKQLIKRWLENGAKYAKHWAFIRPEKSPLPNVSNLSWIQNEIDHFVLAKLNAENLQPTKKAAKERLLRRVTFDLIGLPPTLAEIDAFVSDQSENAFEKVVDGLLKRAEFGERLTTEWLDVARYSDSFGYQVDRGRHVWPWRDWVIKSFNNNLPYDQFIKYQLAGDMLPNASEDQILATAFNRLHPQKVEGGSVPEEFRIEYVADRNHTFGTAFLGLTLECSRCHDHKYDPLSQTEYYQFFSYFNNIDEAGLYSYFTNSTPTPTLLMSNSNQKKTLAELNQKIVAKEQELTKYKVDQALLEKWLAEAKAGDGLKPVELVTFEDYKTSRNQSVPGKTGKGVKLTGDDAIGLKTGNFTRNQRFSISLWINTPDVKERAVVFHRSRAWTDAASRGYQLLIENGQLSFSLIHFWPGNAIRVLTKDAVPVNQWTQVGITYDGSSKASGIQIFLDGKLVETETVRDNLYKNITGGGGDKIAIGERFRDKGFKNGLVDEFYVFDSQLSEIEMADLYQAGVLDDEKVDSTNWFNSKTKKQLGDFYRLRIDQKYAELQKQLRELREQRSKQQDGIIEVMVMNDLAKRRETYRLDRGAYDQPREEVFSDVPKVFESDTQPKNRLELANWLVGPQNPLTARVTVNRYWQMVFGEGLVRTPEDFGSQGQPPTHPQLLDWLAVDFSENGWNLKRLLKLMVMSATYQQDSTLTKSLYEKDPENRLLARASSFRLQAEMLRDNALASSGLLVQKIGGAGTKPYDLALSFKPIAADSGEGLYRRSLYTYWKRTGPAPVMMTLDAAKRDVCTVKRERTATPLQSFVLLNDPQFVESARVLAEKILLVSKTGESNVSESKVSEGKDAGGTVAKAKASGGQSDDSENVIEANVTTAFRILTSRCPSGRERLILKKEFVRQKKQFADDMAAAAKYLTVGKKKVNEGLVKEDLAALTVIVQAIMNFDECLMRR